MHSWRASISLSECCEGRNTLSRIHLCTGGPGLAVSWVLLSLRTLLQVPFLILIVSSLLSGLCWERYRVSSRVVACGCMIIGAGAENSDRISGPSEYAGTSLLLSAAHFWWWLAHMGLLLGLLTLSGLMVDRVFGLALTTPTLYKDRELRICIIELWRTVYASSADFYSWSTRISRYRGYQP